MKKVELLKTKDGSELFCNDNDVLFINSKHNSLGLIYENVMYSESVFTTTGKEKWLDLIFEYDYRCSVSEKFPDLITTYVIENGKSKPVAYMKTSAFSMTINAIDNLLEHKGLK